MKDKKVNLLIVFTALSSGLLLTSNLVATKLWSLGGIAVDGGILVFPFIYILNDVMVEMLGRKTANRIVWAGFLVNFIAVIAFWLVGLLPEFPGWGHQDAYQTILGFAPRVIFASLAAYVISSLLNNLIFEKIAERTKKNNLWARMIGSSAIAKIFDSLVFETIAFFGVLPFSDFVKQVIFAYLAAVVLEIILMPIISVVVRKLHAVYDR